jgi:lysophospholipase L1-like esterase
MIVGWVVVVAGLIEVFVRVFADDGMQFDLEMWKYARDVKQVSSNAKLGHEHAPNRRATLMGVDFQTNSRGLRDRDFPYEKPAGRLRVLMLGDSLTVGWGVRVEDTFSKRIEVLLRKRGLDIDVINTGVGNYNTIQQVTYFLTEGYKYKPDIVVLNYFVNDAEPVPQSTAPSFIARNCMSCIFIAGRLDTFKRMLSAQQSWDNYYLSFYNGNRSDGWLGARDAIRQLADYCRANGIKLMIASLPELHDVKDYRFAVVTDLVRAAANDSNAEFVDALPSLRREEAARLWVTPPDPHPNARANELIADALLEPLQRIVNGKLSHAKD